MTISKVIEDTKKRQKRNANGSVYVNPILMIGKEVPHNAPAKIVKNTALALLLNRGLGNRSSPALF
jgi:hypothetical protein